MRKNKSRWKRGILCLFCLGIIGICLIFGLSAYMERHTAKRILSAEDTKEIQADCILILGCGVRPDGSPSLMLRDRLETAVALYEMGASDRLLASGDHGQKEYDEVNTMKEYILARGIPSEVVFMDHAGFSTYDSVYRAGGVFQAKKILIVSQNYHLPRALYLAERLGLDAYGVAAQDVRYGGQSYRDLREKIARAKDFFVAWIQPNPKYLGEAIPVSGDGNVTNDKE